MIHKWNVECFIILKYPEQYVQTLYLLCNKLMLKKYYKFTPM